MFPAAIFTREIKSSTRAFAEDKMGLLVSVYSLEKLLKSYKYKDQRIAKTAVPTYILYEFKFKSKN